MELAGKAGRDLTKKGEKDKKAHKVLIMALLIVLLVNYFMPALSMPLRCTCMDNKRSPCLQLVAVQVRQQLKDVKGSAP
jgi:hypothetical protein